jgi:cyclopropane-fatty-acyl-phospholipid synthase
MITNTTAANQRSVGTSIPRAARLLFAVLSKLHHGRLDVVAPRGQLFSFSGTLPGPVACVELRNWDVCRDILSGGDIGFAEAFLDSRWVTSDLTAVLSVVALNHFVFEPRWGTRLAYRLHRFMRFKHGRRRKHPYSIRSRQ